MRPDKDAEHVLERNRQDVGDILFFGRGALDHSGLVSLPARQLSEKFDICICADFQTHRAAIPVFAGGTSLVMPNPFGRNRCPCR